MKTTRLLLVCAAALAPAAMAQRWEAGGGAGGGFYTSQDVSLAGSSVSAKIDSNIAGSAWLGNNSALSKWGGQLQFDYQLGNLALNGDGSSASFAARSYAIHYDVLWHFTPLGSKVRPYVALGAGIKVYQGTGAQVAYQPLENFALLTQAQDVTPLISAGAGVKVQIASRVQLRFELHDYATTFPKQVITPNTGAKVGSWLMDFVPMVGISYTSPEGR
jgi:hypothetical protein